MKLALLVGFLSTGCALVSTKVSTTVRASSSAVHSWQPNKNFNGESSGRLTDFERSARAAGGGDRTVTIPKPLGLILDDDANGDVFVKEIVKGGNAEAIGGVKVGDTIAMASATFGGQMWSTRGVGLQRVMRAVEVRAGDVSLVVQSKEEKKNVLSNLFGARPRQQDKIDRERIVAAEQKRNTLEDEIKNERKEAAKGWFGLF
ncbi:hypothetical protein SO694_00007453 [Aureococcus anophagefferens]|uniref:Expressed protein n=2 Tax=Aureococcus anophagefferens TaxID=44056 RepID=F0YFJ2_AURAN|nr:expressed protein [Aureococcus anophagefferens]EGB06245.1 expressed protein [Aureococcus anophagefferens]KAH8074393.1 hypothetical protein JL721_1951 [Aureococcus anophagefferens]|eukprot:XP_009039192.1 expressed protein [Aureococcus anophagefferens]